MFKMVIIKVDNNCAMPSETKPIHIGFAESAKDAVTSVLTDMDVIGTEIEDEIRKEVLDSLQRNEQYIDEENYTSYYLVNLMHEIRLV